MGSNLSFLLTRQILGFYLCEECDFPCPRSLFSPGPNCFQHRSAKCGACLSRECFSCTTLGQWGPGWCVPLLHYDNTKNIVIWTWICFWSSGLLSLGDAQSRTWDAWGFLSFTYLSSYLKHHNAAWKCRRHQVEPSVNHEWTLGPASDEGRPFFFKLLNPTSIRLFHSLLICNEKKYRGPLQWSKW